MDYIKKLQNIGFKKEEAEVYLACLKLGMAKPADLAKEIDIPRTSIYIYAKNLLEKGYLKKSKKDGSEYFIAVEPNYILGDIKEKMESFSGIVSGLEKLMDFSGKKPKSEYFDTKQGMVNLYESMLKINYKHIPYMIESGEAMKQNIEKLGWDFWLEWEKKFLEKKIMTQGIITKSAIPVIQSAPEKIKEILRQRPSTVRVIDEEEFPFSVNLYLLYPNLIYIVVPQQNFTLMLESENIYSSLATMYHALFERAEKLDIGASLSFVPNSKLLSPNL